MGYRKNLKYVLSGRFKKELEVYLDVLKPGTYKWNDSLSALILRNEIREAALAIVNNASDELNTKGWLFKKWISTIINSLFSFSVTSDFNQKMNASVIMFGTVDKDIKFFDFEKGIVLSKYSKNKIMAIESAKKNLTLYLDTTVLEEFPTENKRLKSNNLVAERLIINKSFILEDFLTRCYFGYLHKHVRGSRSVLEYKEIRTFKLPKEEIIKQYESKIYGKIYPIIFLHGDVWRSNILKEQDKYYLIDYEKAGCYFYLYDFFTIIFYEYFFNEDMTPLEEYFKGRYDPDIKAVAEVLGDSFCKERRTELFSAFVVDMYNKRWAIENYIPISHLTVIFEQFY